MQTLKDKNILITGGTSVLGRTFVRQALSLGANVFFTYHQNEEESQRLNQQGAKGFQLDLSKVPDIDAFVQEFKTAAEARIDVLIHNAATVRDHTIQNLSEDDWDFVLNVNLKAPFYLTKKLLRLIMLRRKDAIQKIFFITSRLAIGGGFGVSNYAAAKAGLIGLTKSLAQEVGARGILVNALNPGFMKSAMTKDCPEVLIQQNLEANPTGRWSDPAEVAGFLTYLCSEEMTQVTGQVFHFEGRKT